eukprot:1180980-Prorocentrum_minimum.AAC.4
MGPFDPDIASGAGKAAIARGAVLVRTQHFTDMYNGRFPSPPSIGSRRGYMPCPLTRLDSPGYPLLTPSRCA